MQRVLILIAELTINHRWLSTVFAVSMIVIFGDWILSDDPTLLRSESSDLVWLSGIEARIQDDSSLTECITSALDTLKGTLCLYAANFDDYISCLAMSAFEMALT